MAKEIKTVKESPEVSDEIIVRDPQVLRPVELPLVVELPAGASKAQEAYAKVLNSYAYQNPEKWAKKQSVLISKLKELKNAPDPVEENLKFGTKNTL